jgi:uncharacterized protein YoxC
MTPPTAYPNLGFDPCPGSPDSISTLQQRISTAVTTTKQANDLIHKLRDDQSGIWRGMAGHAFRSHLSITLIDDLASANQALNKAVSTLKGWGTSLAGFRQRAEALEKEAAQDKQKKAAGNPDLKLAGQSFGTEAELRDAQQKLDNAALALRNASSDVDAAEDALKDVSKKAHDLNDEWDEAATKAARELRNAAKFSPKKAGLLSRIGNDLSEAALGLKDWAADHLDDIHDVLSTISAISGLVALCTPPPADVVALAVSLVAGVGALGCTLADSQVRKDIGEMFHGDFSGNLGSAFQLGGDALGLLPVVGMGRGAFTAVKAGEPLLGEGIRGFPRIVDIASRAAHDPGFIMNNVEKWVPVTKDAMAALNLLSEPTSKAKGATADMLNFLNKTRGTVQKSVGTAWNGVTGGDD